MATELSDKLDSFSLTKDEDLCVGLSTMEVEEGLDARDKSVYVVVLGGGSINANGFRSAMSNRGVVMISSRWKSLRKISIIFSRILKIQQKRALYKDRGILDFWVAKMVLHYLLLLLLVLCDFFLFAAATSSLWLTVCLGGLRRREPRVSLVFLVCGSSKVLRVSPPLSSITGGLSVPKAAWCLSSVKSKFTYKEDLMSFTRIGGEVQGNSISSNGAKIYFEFFTGNVAAIGAKLLPLGGRAINDRLLTVAVDGGLGDGFNGGEFLYENYRQKPDINTLDPIGANNISCENNANYSGEYDSPIGSDGSSPTDSISSVMSCSHKESQSFNVPSFKIVFPCIWDLEYTRLKTSMFDIFFLWKSLFLNLLTLPKVAMDDSIEKHNPKAFTFKMMFRQVRTYSTSTVVGALSSLPVKRHTIHSDSTTDDRGRIGPWTCNNPFSQVFPNCSAQNTSISHTDHLALVLQLNQATPSVHRPAHRTQRSKIKVGFASRSTYLHAREEANQELELDRLLTLEEDY
ncbi:hypothetical protein M9H77_27836 [Catharanthus roseus]|uniref:Uncharacterized protein n=1 Tax=Catharanthus roseus TaxID=4058 RepID=A0ACC0AGC7_CATRO|nr:hypothetical protein M9H77_27836 [Catharanthus roseus]